ncbi:hypothetical protein BCR43DRAFT_72979 [Syncephalastrum racemosum]|uniref:Uncharacterized protein n=1 Tax=Syncephalastrum racemosum TaxID=13706 RepID=A0A1X2H239_SYNRA|nr:hypothetical protein BCR43DRAFT_72979 [Syncephalastrum racemosum]
MMCAASGCRSNSEEFRPCYRPYIRVTQSAQNYCILSCYIGIFSSLLLVTPSPLSPWFLLLLLDVSPEHTYMRRSTYQGAAAMCVWTTVVPHTHAYRFSKCLLTTSCIPLPCACQLIPVNT